MKSKYMAGVSSTVFYVGAAVFVCTVLAYLASPARHALPAIGPLTEMTFSSRPIGTSGTADFALYLTDHSHAVVSFWHDIPLPPQHLDGQRVVPMVVEIPKGTVAKMEINKERPWNPIVQDTKNGRLRDYPMPSVVHYGAVPRTFEHPLERDDFTGLLGDGDPVDIVDVSALPAAAGQVHWVRVLGALAMEDDGAADWKIVAVRADDVKLTAISDLAQVVPVHRIEQQQAQAAGRAPRSAGLRRLNSRKGGAEGARVAETLGALRQFFRDYKKKNPADESEPSPVKFAFDGAFLGADAAVAVLRHHHIHWCRLVDEAAAGKRVGGLSDAFHGYQTACDAARQAWQVSLRADEAVGAAAGSGTRTGKDDAGSPTRGMWLPVEVDAAASQPQT